MYVYAVENLQQRWYIGVEHTRATEFGLPQISYRNQHIHTGNRYIYAGARIDICGDFY